MQTPETTRTPFSRYELVEAVLAGVGALFLATELTVHVLFAPWIPEPVRVLAVVAGGVALFSGFGAMVDGAHSSRT